MVNDMTCTQHELLRDGKLKLDKAGDAHCWTCDADLMGDDGMDFGYGEPGWKEIAIVLVLALGALGVSIYQLSI